MSREQVGDVGLLAFTGLADDVVTILTGIRSAVSAKTEVLASQHPQFNWNTSE
jgi:hypothetical protein